MATESPEDLLGAFEHYQKDLTQLLQALESGGKSGAAVSLILSLTTQDIGMLCWSVPADWQSEASEFHSRFEAVLNGIQGDVAVLQRDFAAAEDGLPTLSMLADRISASVSRLVPAQSNPDPETDAVESLLKTLRSTPPNLTTTTSLGEVVASLEWVGDGRAIAPLNQLIGQVENMVGAAKREGAPQGMLAPMESLSAQARKAISTLEESVKARQLRETPQTALRATERTEGRKAKGFLGTLLGRRQDAAEGEPVPSGPAPDLSNEEGYVRSCSEVAFSEEKEERTFQGDRAFQRVLGPLNSQQYPAAIKAAESLIPRFPDFDLPYKWLASAYLATDQLQLSQDALARGLAKSKRKSLLLTDMGETQWRMGDIHQAVYSWCQALHCFASNPGADEYSVYLLLSYVAKGCGLGDAEQRLLRRVDTLRSGQVRLDPATTQRLTALVRVKKDSAMSRVVQDISGK